MVKFFGATPGWAVVTICILIAIFGAAFWQSAKGEGGGLFYYLCSIIIGFNVKVTFIWWLLEWLAGAFGGMASWLQSAEDFGGGIGIIATMLVLLGMAWFFRKVKFDQLSMAMNGAIFGVILRLVSDLLFYLAYILDITGGSA